MAIPLEDYKKIFAQMPRRGKGDQLELTDEDELALDRAWAALATAERKRKQPAENENTHSE